MQRSDADSGRSSCSASSCQGGAICPPADGRRRDSCISKQVQAELPRRQQRVTREASTNTELRISELPRSHPRQLANTALQQRLANYQNRQLVSSQNDISTYRSRWQHDRDAHRRGGLSSAFSLLDVSSSSRLSAQPSLQNVNSDLNVSYAGTRTANDYCIRTKSKLENLRVRRYPVQRAASRLYKTDNSREGTLRTSETSCDACIGPEFIVRGSQPAKQLDITTSPGGERRKVLVILLNGQKLDITCDPNTATGGKLFQAIIQSERYEHNFMLGISALVGGDFVFLPDEYRIRKVAPENWSKVKSRYGRKYIDIADASFTLYLRVKFFLPTNISRTVRGGPWRHRIYLQLRRSIVEGQITSHLHKLIQLAGYALHIEFGNYSYRDHTTGDYFVLEHYLPEGSALDNEESIRSTIIQIHQSLRGVDKERARENFIAIAHTFKDYGAHFYTATWATSDGYSRDIWLTVSPRGIVLYSRNTCISALPKETFTGNSSGRILLQSLSWPQIHKLYYNKKTLYVIPHSRIGKPLTKYKLKMENNKSYFTFWLASLHHCFYLKLYTEHNFLVQLSDEMSHPISPRKLHRSCSTAASKRRILNFENDIEQIENTAEDCSNYCDSYNMAVRGNRHRLGRHNKIGNVEDDGLFEELQNKENEHPHKRSNENCSFDKSVCPTPANKVSKALNQSVDIQSSSENCSLPRRQGVKMGTRAFSGTPNHRHFHSLDTAQLARSLTFSDVRSKALRETHSDAEIVSYQSDDDGLPSMNLLASRKYKYSTSIDELPSAYVIGSPRVCSERSFAYQPTPDDSKMDQSIQEKLEQMGAVEGERRFVTATLCRDARGAFGMQLAEGGDGNTYISSVNAGGPADIVNKLKPGDQIISVNGQSVIGIKYAETIKILQNAPSNVELIVLQNFICEEGNKDKCIAEETGSSDVFLSPKHCFTTRKNSSDRGIVAQLLKRTSFSKLSLFEKNEPHAKSVLFQNNNNKPHMDHLSEADILNAEALKTIQALIEFTKRGKQSEEIPSFINQNGRASSDFLQNNSSFSGDNSSADSSPLKRDRYHERKQISESVNSYLPTGIKNMDTDFDIEPFHADCSSSLFRNDLSRHDLMKCKIALPRSLGLGRKRVGPVRYPVTPCKNEEARNNTDGAIKMNKCGMIMCNSSDDDQVFI